MKQWLTVMVLLAMIVCASPAAQSQEQTKVIERSEKRQPDWLGGDHRGYIFVEVEAPSLTEAQDAAVREIARRVVMAVAANVVHSTGESIEFEQTSSSTNETERFTSATEIAAARLPFVRGISLSEAAGTYWEKLQGRKSGRISYRYAVLYPFPDSRLEQLRREFESADAEKDAELRSLKAGLETVGSGEEIEQAIAALVPLKEYFLDSVRRSEAASLEQAYRNLYKSLTLDAETPSDGVCRFMFRLNGRPFKAVAVPKVTSNCASRLAVRQLDDGLTYEVTYDDTDCLPTEDNWIELTLRLRSARLTQKVFIP